MFCPVLPYSSDSAPHDFWLFAGFKEKFAGWSFSCLQDLAKAVNSELRALSPSGRLNALESWHRQLELCVQSGGVYVEEMSMF